ncbi:MAG TPA: PA14 domain-containing protein [Chthoniobacteraceae bacterium]|jgi:hypothetical protein|nr:PA14 domain-containing protein [Chthoniobacteraceae bacterium]
MFTNERSHAILPEILLRVARARFFSVSLLVHILLVIFVGGIVLVHQREEPPDFAAGVGDVLTEHETAPPDPQPDATLPPNTSVAMPASGATMPAASSIPSAILSSAATATSLQAAMPGTMALTTGFRHGLSGPDAAAGSGAGIASGSQGVLGSKQQIAGAFVGVFYDLKQTRGRRPTGVDPGKYHQIFRKYIAAGWPDGMLSSYYRGPSPIYATQIFTPDFSADDGPKSFGLEKEVQPRCWLVHYKARVSPPEDGEYHFVGAGDDVMLVRFNGKLVLDRCWNQSGENETLKKEQKDLYYGWSEIPHGFAEGPGFHAEAGMFYDMDVLIGEEPGGKTYAVLLVEKDGAEYQKDARGNPILPVLRLADAPLPALRPGDSSYAPHQENGPVWKAQPPSDAANGSEDFDQFFRKKL